MPRAKLSCGAELLILETMANQRINALTVRRFTVCQGVYGKCDCRMAEPTLPQRTRNMAIIRRAPDFRWSLYLLSLRGRSLVYDAIT